MNLALTIVNNGPGANCFQSSFYWRIFLCPSYAVYWVSSPVTQLILTLGSVVFLIDFLDWLCLPVSRHLFPIIFQPPPGVPFITSVVYASARTFYPLSCDVVFPFPPTV